MFDESTAARLSLLIESLHVNALLLKNTWWDVPWCRQQAETGACNGARVMCIGPGSVDLPSAGTSLNCHLLLASRPRCVHPENLQCTRRWSGDHTG